MNPRHQPRMRQFKNFRGEQINTTVRDMHIANPKFVSETEPKVLNLATRTCISLPQTDMVMECETKF